jgi:hypothetical protein
MREDHELYRRNLRLLVVMLAFAALLFCRHPSRLAANEVRFQLHALAYNLANCLRTLATPEEIGRWSLKSLRRQPRSGAFA